MYHFDNFFGSKTIKVSHLGPERMCIGFFLGLFWGERVNIPCRILVKETVFHALMCPLQTLLLLNKKRTKPRIARLKQGQHLNGIKMEQTCKLVSEAETMGFLSSESRSW